ncbi:YqeG family HAD IIIA-type phosphatase [Tumebacillus sp. ITR2]|uniref:YqeG family HAD IIIA-type phosphatase n=1 Tax=Tumebacillus amylolyticus TaxID=2801339 RepID=A0ABS1JAM3_9BACL|nr:YqeG family HAD IIIA-type phosphatase [Tumebacillus amylolyticus]MBL0387333.1 YqeG family HAD IIIA-type phosphatase [Tumebacillus amylolyticus]
MRRLVPSLFVESVYEIDLEQLKARGVRGIITDLDNTLVRWDEPDATPKILQWLDHVRDTYGIKVCIVSNNNHQRVERFAKPLNIPWVAKAKKPSNTPFHRALEVLGTKREDTVVIGDQLFTDVLGGNRMGMYTILVVPVGEKEFIGTKVLRAMERIAFSILRRRGMIPWE